MEKILYFDCAMGAAGDMLSAALLELMPDREKYEYEDLSRIAREKKMSLTQLLEQLEKIR